MMTKLEAVNEMLAAIGEEPVATLASGLPDAEAAEDTLDRISKQVQAPGWYVNTETFEWALDVNNEIRLPSTVLRIDTVEEDKTLAVRKRRDGNFQKLWRIEDRTFKFVRPPKVEVIWHLPFDDLNFELQVYIVARAAKTFQAENMGSVALDTFNVRDEDEALAAVEDAEAEAEDSNALTDNAYCRNQVYRHSPPKSY